MTFRRIATEEAFIVPELAELFHHISRTNWSSLDIAILRINYRDPTGPRVRRLLDLEEERLAEMDREGVAMQVLSLTSPGVQILEPGLATDIARLANDRLAETIARHPTRFAGLAAFAPQDPAAAAKEMERAVRTLGLKGFILNSHTDGRYLDDEFFWPVLEAAEALDAPIYIHPRCPSDGMAAPFRLKEGGIENGNFENAAWGFAVETGTHAVRMILSGLFDRFPKLKIVLGHMGENIPFALWRLDRMGGVPRNRNISLQPSAYFKRNFTITTSGVECHKALAFSLDMLGEDNVMWAIDYPYQESGPAVTFMDSAPIADAVKHKVYAGNAERLFKLSPGA
ncbi:MAG TPA: amidohydrolase family protein [Allosphingosinicella sp.]|nr:amidohydrolase family protein [Allosphingosinicella sp.]